MTPFQNFPKNVGDLGKLISAKGFKKLPKVQKSPNLVTLLVCSVIKFFVILQLWPYLKCGHFLHGLFYIWQSNEPTLGYF